MGKSRQNIGKGPNNRKVNVDPTARLPEPKFRC